MKHPKTKLVAQLRRMARQARERAELRTQQDRERRDNAMADAHEAAPAIRDALTEAADLLDQPFTADAYEQALTFIRRAERWHSQIHIPKAKPGNGFSDRSDDLNRAAGLLAQAEGDMVSTSELSRLGILNYLRV